MATRTDGRGWTISYLYDPVGREIKRVYPNDARVTSTYDLAGRVLAVRDESGISSFTLDPLGRRTKVFDPSGVQLRYTYDAVGNRLTMRDQDSGLTTYEYNANDQLELLVNPFAETTSWSWDRLGRVAEQKLANGVRASQTYNSLGQMTNLLHIRPDGEVFGAYTATCDRVGNRTQVEEVHGTYSYGYDRTHQLTSEQRIGSYAYAYSYVYDPVGNRLLMDQGNGNVVSYTYDLGDQLLATSPAGPDEALCVFEQAVAPPYSRDALALRYTMHETELFVEQASLAVVGAAGTWDASNHWRMTLQVRDESLAPVRTLATATYEQAGAGIVRLTVPALEQAVDGAASPELTVRVEKIGAPGNLLSVTGSATVWEDIGGAWVRAGDGAFPALLPDPYHQDALGLTLPLSAGHTYEVVAATVNLVGAAGTWDAGNHWVLSLSSRSAALGVDTVLTTATFDSGGQGAVALTPASPVEVDADTTPVLAIAFERVGNPGLLLRANATLAFAGAGEAGITSITYDQNGNTVSEAGASGTTTYTWNAEDRLVAVATLTGTETYTYDARGLRRKKVTPAASTQFVWHGQNLLAELDGDLETQAQQTDFPGYWGGLASRRAGGESAFYAFDMSGNNRAVSDDAASVQTEQTLSAFGIPFAGDEVAGGFGGQFGYQADIVDRLYVRARHLTFRGGRWRSRDPLPGRRSFVSLYVYADNNPVLASDPTGLETWCEFISNIAADLPDCGSDPNGCINMKNNRNQLWNANHLYWSMISYWIHKNYPDVVANFKYWLTGGRLPEGGPSFPDLATLKTYPGARGIRGYKSAERIIGRCLPKRVAFTHCPGGRQDRPRYYQLGFSPDRKDFNAAAAWSPVALRGEIVCELEPSAVAATCVINWSVFKDWAWSDPMEEMDSVPQISDDCKLKVWDAWGFALTDNPLVARFSKGARDKRRDSMIPRAFSLGARAPSKNSSDYEWQTSCTVKCVTEAPWEHC